MMKIPKSVGCYVVETMSEASYRKSLKHKPKAQRFMHTSEDRDAFEKVLGFCDQIFLIDRRVAKIRDKSFKINFIRGNEERYVPQGVIKKTYTENEAKEKFPEFFL